MLGENYMYANNLFVFKNEGKWYAGDRSLERHLAFETRADATDFIAQILSAEVEISFALCKLDNDTIYEKIHFSIPMLQSAYNKLSGLQDRMESNNDRTE